MIKFIIIISAILGAGVGAGIIARAPQGTAPSTTTSALPVDGNSSEGIAAANIAAGAPASAPVPTLAEIQAISPVCEPMVGDRRATDAELEAADISHMTAAEIIKAHKGNEDRLAFIKAMEDQVQNYNADNAKMKAALDSLDVAKTDAEMSRNEIRDRDDALSQEASAAYNGPTKAKGVETEGVVLPDGSFMLKAQQREHGPPVVPDPLGLGARLALIDVLVDHFHMRRSTLIIDGIKYKDLVEIYWDRVMDSGKPAPYPAEKK